jgi:hypothetical protein
VTQQCACGFLHVLASHCLLGASKKAESPPRVSGEKAPANPAPTAAKEAVGAPAAKVNSTSIHSSAASSAGSPMSTPRSSTGASTAGSKTNTVSREQAARQWWLQTIAREKYARAAMAAMAGEGGDW